jgi:hypothetical protein
VTPRCVRKVRTVGDVNPIEHGGGYVLTDDDSPEGWIEYSEGISDDDDAWDIDLDDPDTLARVKVTLYRVGLDRLRRETETDDEGNETTRIMPREWFLKDLGSVASYVGSSVRTLVDSLCSDDPCVRASVYQDLASYHGWQNFDSDPLELTLGELVERWKDL